jgi:hypothetical protein
MTYTKTGSFGYAGGGKSGAIVDLWAASRIPGGLPAQGANPPSGSPDAGPVVTGTTEGNPGGYLLTGITTVEDYYVRIQYGGTAYWGGCPAGSLAGQESGGGAESYNLITPLSYGPVTPMVYGVTTSLAAVNPNLSVGFTFPSGLQVVIEANILVVTEVVNAFALPKLCFVTHGTTTQVTPLQTVNGITNSNTSAVTSFQRVTYTALVTTEVAGEVVQWDLAAVANIAGAVDIQCDDGTTSGNTYGPAIISVFNPAA